jgi:hypothetical protein
MSTALAGKDIAGEVVFLSRELKTPVIAATFAPRRRGVSAYSPLMSLGRPTKARGSHVHGGLRVRVEPTAALRPCMRRGCARRTATKCHNTTTATRHPAGLNAALACSVPTWLRLREVRDEAVLPQKGSPRGRAQSEPLTRRC